MKNQNYNRIDREEYPWSKLVEAVGIEPRSTLIKLAFVG